METRRSRLDEKGRPVVAWPEPMAVAMGAHWGALAIADASASADLAALEEARIAKGKGTPLPVAKPGDDATGRARMSIQLGKPLDDASMATLEARNPDMSEEAPTSPPKGKGRKGKGKAV
jgi:hypothetical protein